MRSSDLARVLERHARDRAAGQPVPAVLVGTGALDAWLDAASTVVRVNACDAESAALAYLADPSVRARLRELVIARAAASRRGSVARVVPAETSFERDVAVGVLEDALLGAGDVDAHVLAGFVVGRRPASAPLRVLAAALRVLGADCSWVLLESERCGLDLAVRIAVALVEAAPALPIGVPTGTQAWRDWREAPGREHAKAMVEPYVVEAPSRLGPSTPDVLRSLVARTRRTATTDDDDLARSAAERALFEALEADPRSRGLFALNATLRVPFGGRPLEIDLSSPSLRVAVEVDGFFHFRDDDAYRRDRRKDFLLQREGYFVVRVLAEDVASSLNEVLATVHEAIAFRSLQEKERNR